jgi:hypothetical protein
MSESLFIYLPPGFTGARDELEDAVADLLGKRGEVTGGGAGIDGCNVDVEVFDPATTPKIVDSLVKMLRAFPVPRGTLIDLPDQAVEHEVWP